MSKFVLIEKDHFSLLSNRQSFIRVDTNHKGEIYGDIIVSGCNISLTPSTVLNFSSICIKAGYTLTSQVPLGQLGNVLSIIAPTNLYIDVQNGHNLCIAQNLAPVTVTLDGTLTLADVSHAPIDVGLHVGSTMNVTHNGKNYSFTNHENLALGNGGYVYLGNVNQFVTVCSTVNELIKNTTDENPFPLEMVCFLRDYQKLDHSLVKVFMAQNNMLQVTSIDSFIAAHFFEFGAIAHSLADSLILEGCEGNYDPMQMICSYLDLEDVILSGDNTLNNDEATS